MPAKAHASPPTNTTPDNRNGVTSATACVAIAAADAAVGVGVCETGIAAAASAASTGGGGDGGGGDSCRGNGVYSRFDTARSSPRTSATSAGSSSVHSAGCNRRGAHSSPRTTSGASCRAGCAESRDVVASASAWARSTCEKAVNACVAPCAAAVYGDAQLAPASRASSSCASAHTLAVVALPRLLWRPAASVVCSYTAAVSRCSASWCSTAHARVATSACGASLVWRAARRSTRKSPAWGRLAARSNSAGNTGAASDAAPSSAPTVARCEQCRKRPCKNTAWPSGVLSRSPATSSWRCCSIWFKSRRASVAGVSAGGSSATRADAAAAPTSGGRWSSSSASSAVRKPVTNGSLMPSAAGSKCAASSQCTCCSRSRAQDTSTLCSLLLPLLPASALGEEDDAGGSSAVARTSSRRNSSRVLPSTCMPNGSASDKLSTAALRGTSGDSGAGAWLPSPCTPRPYALASATCVARDSRWSATPHRELAASTGRSHARSRCSSSRASPPGHTRWTSRPCGSITRNACSRARCACKEPEGPSSDGGPSATRAASRRPRQPSDCRASIADAVPPSGSSGAAL